MLFLSVGDDVGQRTVIFNGISDFSGKFVIEDVTQEDKTLSRRLIFLSNPNVVQSEARLIVPGILISIKSVNTLHKYLNLFASIFIKIYFNF